MGRERGEDERGGKCVPSYGLVGDYVIRIRKNHPLLVRNRNRNSKDGMERKESCLAAGLTIGSDRGSFARPILPLHRGHSHHD